MTSSNLVILTTLVFILTWNVEGEDVPEPPMYDNVYIVPDIPERTSILSLNSVIKSLLGLPPTTSHRLISVDYGNRTYNSLPIRIGNESSFMLCQTKPKAGPAGYFCINETTWELITTPNYAPVPDARERIKLELRANDLSHYYIPIFIRSPCEVQQIVYDKMVKCRPSTLKITLSQFNYSLTSYHRTKTLRISAIKFNSFGAFNGRLIISTNTYQVLYNTNISLSSFISIVDRPITTEKIINIGMIVPTGTEWLYFQLITNNGPIVFPTNGKMTLHYYTMDTFCNQWECLEDFYHWFDVISQIPPSSEQRRCVNDTYGLSPAFTSCNKNFSVGLQASSIQHNLGNSFSLKCNFDTFLPYEITWFRIRDANEEILPSTSIWYNVTNLDYDDHAYYKCVVVTPANKYVRENPSLYHLKLQDVFTGELRISFKDIKFTAGYEDKSSSVYKTLTAKIKEDVELLFRASDTSNNNVEYANIQLLNQDGGQVLARGDFSMLKNAATVFDWMLDVVKKIKDGSIIDNPGPNDIILYTEETCREKIQFVNNGMNYFLIPASPRGSTRDLSCPVNNNASARTKCEGVPPYYAYWSDLDDQQCVYPDPTNELTELANTKVTTINVISVSKKLEETSQNMVSSEDVALVTTTLENIGDLVTVDQEVTDNTMIAIDNVLNMPRDVLTESQNQNQTTNRVLKFIGDTGEKLAQINAPPVNKTRFAMATLMVDPNNFRGLHADAVKKDSLNQINIQQSASPETEGKETKAELFLPSSITDKLPKNRKIPIVLVTYSGNELFAIKDVIVNKSDSKEIVNTQIISADIRGHTIQDLDRPVILKFTATNSSYVKNKKRCVYWDISKNAWTDEGCYFYSSEGETFTCHCSHLTNFAMLFNAIPPSDIHGDILTIITYVGLALSMCGAFLALLTYCLFPMLRDKIPPKILMNLCAALLLMNILFLIGVERITSETGCRVIAIFLQYFFLCVFSWSAVEGFHSARGLVFPMRVEINAFVQKACIFAWGTPIILTAIGAGVWYEDYGDENSCVVRDKPFFITVLIPIVATLLFNFISLVTITCSLRNSSSSKYSSHKLKLKDRFRIIMAFMVLFGLTWVFGILVISNDEVVFQYLFCILSGLQGLYIFLFYCARNKRVRRMYRGLLSGQSIREVQRSTTRRGQSRQRAETVESTVFTSVNESKLNSLSPQLNKKIEKF